MKVLAQTLLLLSLIAFGTGGFAQEAITNTAAPIKVKYGSKGFQFETTDGKNKMNIQWRLQFRGATPYGKDLSKVEDFDREETSLWINRARMKVGGHGYTPNLTYYLEYDVVGSRLLDYRIMYKFNRALNLKVGQWKTHYSSERIISSGKQLAMDRSIVNGVFTLDRQQGISLFGNIGPNNIANFSYWLAALTGRGRGQSSNDDDKLLYMARLQWNPTGKQMKFTGGDNKRSQNLQLMLAVAGAINTSSSTKFSSSGPGNLEGFSTGEPGQYEIKQAVQEFGIKYNGFSLHQEFHVKEIKDNVNYITTTYVGGVAQMGVMLNSPSASASKGLEWFGRYATYFPDYDNNLDNQREEFTTGFNYHIKGHRFKLTAETSYFDSMFPDDISKKEWRHRLQVEVSF